MPPSTAEMTKTSGIKPCQTMRGHTGDVNWTVHLPDGQSIITCSNYGSLRRWDLESGAQIGDDWRDERNEAEVWCIALSPNSKTVASESSGGTVASGSTEGTVASGSTEGTVRLWNVETEKVIAKWAGHTMIVRSLCWSADSEYVVSGSYDGMARVWNVKSGKTVLGPIKAHHDVNAVVYSPDMKMIATGGQNENGVKIWDATTGELLSTLKHEHLVFCLAWTSDQKKLISAAIGSIRIFDTATWQQIAILEDHKDTVNALSLFRNDRLLASVGYDKTARLWNLDTNLPVGPPLKHDGNVRRAAISVDGHLLVTGCSDTNMYIWDIHTILAEAGHEDLLSIPNVSAN